MLSDDLIGRICSRPRNYGGLSPTIILQIDTQSFDLQGFLTQ